MDTSGWHPDPSGQPGQYRYWDGSHWSSVTSPDPSADPPPGSLPPAPPATTGGPNKRARTFALIAGALVVVIVATVIVVLNVNRGSQQQTGNSYGTPWPTATSEPCPPRSTEAPTPQNRPYDGRVHGGQLSYPVLAAPWSEVSTEYRVPFGRDANTQSITTEPKYNGVDSWEASVLVAELSAGDGFPEPKDASEIVVRCIVGSFYGNNAVQRADVTNKETTLDGRRAWLVESKLSFDIPNLQAKSETLIVLIVQTSEISSSLFMASVPNNASQYEPDARRALANLKVDG
ncbi:DUF2510 domain-containing protein [Granulicoccus phenolivorans]|uniref:DUF2510 domain-containing protein n=1 Tax=Granulicoccus phenolivorans TaxID=266854 RepID=UPI0003F74BDE|nr:DUF2510 domain-containing protein [Granulicoccus phenolivorans]